MAGLVGRDPVYVVQRWSASDAGRTSAVRAAELELPTLSSPSKLKNLGPRADVRRTSAFRL